MLAVQELAVQREIADYTAAMALTGIGALLASVLGIVLVWRTFRATGKQVEIAEMQLAALYEAERAILHVKAAEIGNISGRDEEFVVLEIANKGRSPGRILSLVAKAGPGNDGENQAPRWAVVPAEGVAIITSFPVPPKNVHLKAACKLLYRSVGPKTYESHFDVDVRWRGGDPELCIVPRWMVDVSNSQGHPDDT